MSEIVDILCQTTAQAAYFEVDTTLASVPLNFGGPGFLYPAVYNVAAQRKFQWLDNFTVLSMGISMPTGFFFAEFAPDVRPHVTMQYAFASDLVTLYNLPVFTGSRQYIPLVDYEFSIGAYVDAALLDQGLGADEFLLAAQLPAPGLEVSMLNVPASLNGLEFRIPIFAKILHNLELVA